MLTSVFAKSLRDLLPSVIGWSLGLSLLSALTVFLYPTVAAMSELDQLIRSLPQPIQAMIGDPAVLHSIEGFLTLKLFGTLPLLLGVFGVLQGAAALAGEEERGTLDLLLAQPVRRWRVGLEKFLAQCVAQIVICGSIAIALMAACAIIATDVSPLRMAAGTFAALPVGILFGGAAQLASSVLRHARTAGVSAGSLLLAAYFVQALGPLSSSARTLQSVSPFHHASRIVPPGRAIDGMPAVTLLVVAALLVTASLLCFQRKDLSA